MNNLSETIKERIGVIGVLPPIHHIKRIVKEIPDVKVIIIGEGRTSDLLHTIPADKTVLLVSSPIFNRNIISVNGIKYIEKHKQTNKLLPLIQKYDLYNKPKERPNVDIVKEYSLILKYKSTLSKSNRDWVVKEFNKRYEKYEETIK